MEKSLREKLKKVTFLKLVVITYRVMRNKHGVLSKSRALLRFFKSYYEYRAMAVNKGFSIETSNLYPRLFDDTEGTPVDPIYFYQNTWCAKKIFDSKPTHHYDIGSSAEFVGTISQFVPTTMVDIRPLEVELPQLSFIKADIVRLPFKNKELKSISSLCVVEHIGLGRYGDSLDSYGSERACAELVRVLADGGSLYISVPVDDVDRVYFNAHRAFTRGYFLELCRPLKLMEEKYVYGNNLFDEYNPSKGFGTGLYHFKKV